MRRGTVALAAALALPASLLLGCRAVVRPSNTPACRVNADCKKAGQICFAESCRAATPAPVRTIYTELTPPLLTSLTTQQQVLTVTASRGDLVWKSTSHVTGRVIQQGFTTPISGNLVVTPVTSIIAARPLAFNVPSDPLFALDLEPGEYSVTMEPFDNDAATTAAFGAEPRPPVTVDTWTIGASDSQQLPLYPGSTTFHEIASHLAYSAAAPLLGGPKGVRITAAQEGGTLASTIAATDATGAFTSVFVANEVKQVTLRVGPGPSNPFVPTLEIKGLAVGAVPDPIFLNVLLGTPQNLTGVAEGVGPSGTLTVPRALVVATAQVGDGSFTATAATDDTGAFTLTLLRSAEQTPLHYTVLVVPPPGSSFGSTSQTYVLGASGQPSPLAFTLSERPLLHGVIRDHAGHGLANATLQFQPRGAGSSAGFDTNVVSSAGGAYNVPLDGGDYEVALIPAPTSGQPNGIGFITVAAADLSADFSLPPPTLVSGEVVAAVSGKTAPSLTGAGVDFYRFEALPDGTQGLRIAGHATLDDHNHYSAVLPAD